MKTNYYEILYRGKRPLCCVYERAVFGKYTYI